MSTGLAVFDTTVQETNEWLARVKRELACGRHDAYAALRAVLQVLRDRLPLTAVVGLSAQLPMLLRGVFLEGWRPQDGVSAIRSPLTFGEAVEALLPEAFPHAGVAVTAAVFAVMADRLDTGEIDKLGGYLPNPLRDLWADQRPVG